MINENNIVKAIDEMKNELSAKLDKMIVLGKATLDKMEKI